MQPNHHHDNDAEIQSSKSNESGSKAAMKECSPVNRGWSLVASFDYTTVGRRLHRSSSRRRSKRIKTSAPSQCICCGRPVELDPRVAEINDDLCATCLMIGSIISEKASWVLEGMEAGDDAGKYTFELQQLVALLDLHLGMDWATAKEVVRQWINEMLALTQDEDTGEVGNG